MPGLAGILAPSITDNAAGLQRMLARMRHDDTYTSRTVIRPEAGVWAGCDARPAAHQEFWNDAADLGVLLYGEYRLDGDRSPSRLPSLFEAEGTDALRRLNGWFSGVLIDVRNHRTILFNDRYGLGRIYCHESADRLHFSSEAKALLALLPETRGLDDRSLGEWLSCGCVLQNRTLFTGISLLPPGSAWIFEAGGRLAKTSYFNPASLQEQPTLTANEYAARLKETFPRILAPYLNGNQPLAMSLTGGLDGRMIMSWANKGAGALPCYTFNGPIRDCADVKIARRVASACSQPHQSVQLESDFFSSFPALAEESVYLTDGAMDVTGAAELYMNRKARQIAPVRLTGNYGSEILRQYVAFRPRPINRALFAPDCVRSADQAAITYAAEARGNRLAFIAFKQVPWHHHSRFAVEQSQLTIRSPYLDNDLVSLVFQAPAEAATSLEPSLRLIAAGNPLLARIPTDRGITYPASQLSNRLQRPVHEFLARAEYAYDYGMPGWLARLDRYASPLRLERLFLGHQKFCHFRSWYRRELAGCLREILLDSRAGERGHVSRTNLERALNDHIRGTHNYTLELHKLLSLELIHRRLLGSA